MLINLCLKGDQKTAAYLKIHPLGRVPALALDDGGGMRFHGDAIADPLCGLHAALLARSALEAGGGALLSISLSGLVAWLASRVPMRGEIIGTPVEAYEFEIVDADPRRVGKVRVRALRHP